MLEKLVELIQASISALVPFVVLMPYERGVRVRLGRYAGELDPGFHWCWPFHIDVVFNEHITPRTERIAGLATTTADGRAVGFDAVVTYRISNITKALLEVTDLKDAVADSCAGTIGTVLAAANYQDIVGGGAVEAAYKECRARAFKWGVEVMNVQLVGVALVKNLRLVWSGAAHHQGSIINIHPGQE